MLGFIGRLDYQKGVDLICESFDWLMDQGVQLIMLGSGREDLESSLRCAVVWSSLSASVDASGKIFRRTVCLDSCWETAVRCNNACL